MKLIVLFLLALASLFAEYKTGDKLTQFEVKDQFDKSLKIDESVKIFVLATSKASGKVGHSYFENKPATFFDEKKVLYVSDMSAIPSFVLDMFMMGSFKKYKYSLGLLKDEKIAKEMPKKEEHLSVMMLDRMQIKSIEYAKTTDELQKIIEK